MRQFNIRRWRWKAKKIIIIIIKKKEWINLQMLISIFLHRVYTTTRREDKKKEQSLKRKRR